MEPFLADLINNPKVPKWIRMIMVLVLNLFIIALGILCALKSPYKVLGKIFGISLSFSFLIILIYLLRKIHKD